jgi:6-phosphogluconolactonase (cycloisomerase 2 family)
MAGSTSGGSGSSAGAGAASGSSTGSSGSGAGTGSSGATTGSSGAAAGSSGATTGSSGAAAGSSGASGGSLDAGEGGAPTDGGDAGPSKEVLYANAGVELNVFNMDTTSGALTLASSVALPELLQFAEFDSTHKHLYAGVGASTDPTWSFHAFSIDPASGALTEIPAQDGGASGDAGDAGLTGVTSPNGRIINLTLSRDDKYLLAVHNVTKAYTVFALNADGTIGARVPQADGGDVDIGNFVHQIRVDPTNTYATICDRGNDPTYGADGGVVAAEQVGHLLVYTYASGVLTPLTTSTLTFPAGIGPRHIDFHPTQPWVYLSAERGNRLITYTFQNGVLTEKFNVSSVLNAGDAPDSSIDMTEAINGQRAGAIKVHPSGNFLWITNRNYALTPYYPDAGTPDAASDSGEASAPQAIQVFTGMGENTVVLFSIDQTTGEPTLVSGVDAHGFEPRTFALDPSGGYLVVGNQKTINTLTASGVVPVNSNLSVFSVAANGALTFVKTYDQTAGEVWWVGGTTVTGN